MVRRQRAAKNPETKFVAMMAIVARQVCCRTGESYWAYLPDPPVANPASWASPSIPVFTNDTRVVGGDIQQVIFLPPCVEDLITSASLPPYPYAFPLLRRLGVYYYNKETKLPMEGVRLLLSRGLGVLENIYKRCPNGDSPMFLELSLSSIPRCPIALTRHMLR